MDKAKLKQIILNSITIFLGFLIVISLAFTVIKGVWYSESSSYNSEYNGVYKECGFTFLSFGTNMPYVEQDAGIVPILIGLFSLIQLLVGIAVMSLGALKFFFEHKAINKAVKILMIVGVSLSAWYMLEGIAFSSVLANFGKWISTSTSAYLAFILCALAFAGYIVFNKIFKVDGEAVAVAVKEKGAIVKSQKKQMSSIQLLKEYKDLLDAGIITQEEFDEKKKELL